MDKQIWLIGSGYMGIEYAKVLNDLDVNFLTIGRGAESAQAFKEQTGKEVVTGGLEAFLATQPDLPSEAIVAVGIENLATTTTVLLNFGVKKILVEKPAIAYPEEIVELLNIAKQKEADVLLAYNRRFYASIQKAMEIIQEDGGLTSFNFEFTEWSHVIGTLKKHPAEHQNWFLGNSTHIIDAAFYLAGAPTQLQSFVKGQNQLDWHTKSAIFAGAGETANGALFSYQANWVAPGRWAMEFLTPKHRLIFKPIEKLQIQKIGSVAVDFVEGVDYTLDEKYKPGVYLQTKAFLANDFSKLCTLDEQNKALEYYKQIGGY